MTTPSSIMPGFRSVIFSTPSAKLRRLEFGTRIAAGLFQLREDVVDRRHAEFVIGEVCRVERFAEIAVADHRLERSRPQPPTIRSTTRIGFGMHRRRIERIRRRP